MKQTILSRVKKAELATKPRKKCYFGRGDLIPTENGYELTINVSEKWFNREITDIIEKHFDTLQEANSYLDELKRNGYINIIVFRK